MRTITIEHFLAHIPPSIQFVDAFTTKPPCYSSIPPSPTLPLHLHIPSQLNLQRKTPGRQSVSALTKTNSVPVTVPQSGSRSQMTPKDTGSQQAGRGGPKERSTHRVKRNMPTEATQPYVPVVPAAPAPGMYWSRAVTHGKFPPRALRAHTVNLVGELMYVFGGCDAKTCFNNLYVFDLGMCHFCF